MIVTTQMQAAVYRGDGRVVVETLPVPDIGPGEALVRVNACGVCGTDLKKIAREHVDLQFKERSLRIAKPPIITKA